MQDCWYLFDKVVDHTDRLMLLGPPGTGKTHNANHKLKNAINITVTEETPAAEIRGHFIQTDGSFRWMHGPGITAWLQGRPLIINEVNRASADCMSFLLALLDDPDLACLTLPTGEVVRPKDGFRVIGTMNGEMDELPPALHDRFATFIRIDKPHPGALARIPSYLHNAAIEGVQLPEERRTSIRAWIAFSNLSETVGEEVAAQVVFGERWKDLLTAIRVAKGK